MGLPPKHRRLVEAAEEAIRNVHADTDVSQEQTLESLRDLRSTISTLINAMEEETRP